MRDRNVSTVFGASFPKSPKINLPMFCPFTDTSKYTRAVTTGREEGLDCLVSGWTGVALLPSAAVTSESTGPNYTEKHIEINVIRDDRGSEIRVQK